MAFLLIVMESHVAFPLSDRKLERSRLVLKDQVLDRIELKATLQLPLSGAW